MTNNWALKPSPSDLVVILRQVLDQRSAGPSHTGVTVEAFTHVRFLVGKHDHFGEAVVKILYLEQNPKLRSRI